VLGRDLPDDVLRGGIGRPLLDQMRVFDPDRAQELFDVYRTWNHANTERLLARYPGVDELLVELDRAGAAIGVVTSKMRDAVDLAFGILPPPVRYHAVVTAEDTDRHKPGPEPLLHALELLGSRPAEAVYVGDARYDVEAARAAGAAALAVTWGAGDRASLEAAGADGIASTPAELGSLLGLPTSA
jgi:pyrophosphatase PpaX